MYYNNYHVLSNGELINILMMVTAAAVWLIPLIFSYLGARDASPTKTGKGVVAKVAPWLLLLITLSEIALLIVRCANYNWNIEATPSEASIYREIRQGDGYPMWGWANDEQLPLLMTFKGVLLWFSWMIYAFYYKPSDTSWWKKACKAVAYILISVCILGFSVHAMEGFLLYAIFLVIIIVLLNVARAKPAKAAISDSEPLSQEPVETHDIQASEEDLSQYMPRQDVIPEEQPVMEYAQPKEDIITSPDMRKTLDEDASEEEEPLLPSSTDEIAPSLTTDNTEMMYCKHCGKKIEEDSTFCKYCGKVQ